MLSLAESCSLFPLLADKYAIYYNFVTSVLRADHISLLVYLELPDFLKVNLKHWSRVEKISFPFLFPYKTYFFEIVYNIVYCSQSKMFRSSNNIFSICESMTLVTIAFMCKSNVTFYTGFCTKALVKREVLSACFPIAELPRIPPYVSSFSNRNMLLLRLGGKFHWVGFLIFWYSW